jgi:broad specificity phosphatase PhoE
MPAFGPLQPPDQWKLSPEGQLAAVALGPCLPSGAYLSASTEPKAWETLSPFGRPHLDRRFGEVVRLGEPYDGNFRELRRSYIEGRDHPGWEPRAEAAARFDAAIADHLARAGTAPLVVATHGMVMTLWLTARVALAEPGAFWAALRLPDVLRVDLAAATVTRITGN